MNKLEVQITLNKLAAKRKKDTNFYPVRPFEVYHSIADKVAPQMSKAFVVGVSKVRSLIDLKTLETSLTGESLHNSKDVDNIIETMDWVAISDSLLSSMKPSYSLVVQQANKVTQEFMNTDYGMNLSFNVRNPYSQKIIDDDVGTLIRDVTQQAKDQVKAIISDAFEYGGHPYETAKEIRQFIGLTDNQRRMANNRFQSLVDDGMSEEEAYTQGETYTEDLIVRRSETIARTETIRAANGGQQAAWDQASEAGLIDGMKKKWIITPDDRLCEYCLAIADTGPIDLDEKFTDGMIEVLTPPLHPNCRCAMGLVKGGTKEQ